MGLDYQKGWQVDDGFADVRAWWAWSDDLNNYTIYQYTVTGLNTSITKEFNDSGSNHNYIRFSFIPAQDQKINIKNASDTVASVWFNSNGNIYVLDNGSYVDTTISYVNVYNNCWYNYFNTYDYENTWDRVKAKSQLDAMITMRSILTATQMILQIKLILRRILIF